MEKRILSDVLQIDCMSYQFCKSGFADSHGELTTYLSVMNRSNSNFWSSWVIIHIMQHWKLVFICSGTGASTALSPQHCKMWSVTSYKGAHSKCGNRSRVTFPGTFYQQNVYYCQLEWAPLSCDMPQRMYEMCFNHFINKCLRYRVHMIDHHDDCLFFGFVLPKHKRLMC